MIGLKNLKCRIYENNICIRFEYNIPGYTLLFNRIKDEVADEYTKDWFLKILGHFDTYKETEIYNIPLNFPREMGLEFICAHGLKLFQFCLKEEIQEKSNLDFLIGDLTIDMKG